MTRIFAIWSLLLLISCDTVEYRSASSSYFDLDSLIDVQVEILTTSNAALIKSVRIDMEEEQGEFQPDSLGWQKEFNMLRSLSIAEPSYSGAFEIDRNPNRIIYQVKNEANIPVQRLKIEFDSSADEIRRIEGRFLERNSEPVYATSRTIILAFEEGRLSNYRIRGFQKMILKDTVRFDLSGEINYN